MSVTVQLIYTTFHLTLCLNVGYVTNSSCHSKKRIFVDVIWSIFSNIDIFGDALMTITCSE